MAGRPSFCPTDEQRHYVEAMVSFGIPRTEIARVIGISDDTLAKHFREELDTGAAKANARVETFLFETATGQGGDGSAAVMAAIFWAKTRTRWREMAATELLITPASTDETPERRAARAAALVDEAFGRVSDQVSGK